MEPLLKCTFGKDGKLENIEIVPENDARKWAIAFTQAVEFNPAIATDIDCMTAWFANAIMAGYDSPKGLTLWQRLRLSIRARFCPTRNKQKIAKRVIQLTQDEICDRVEPQLRELEGKFD